MRDWSLEALCLCCFRSIWSNVCQVTHWNSHGEHWLVLLIIHKEQGKILFDLEYWEKVAHTPSISDWAMLPTDWLPSSRSSLDTSLKSFAHSSLLSERTWSKPLLSSTLSPLHTSQSFDWSLPLSYLPAATQRITTASPWRSHASDPPLTSRTR